MDVFKQKKFLLWIIIILALMDVLLLGAFLWKEVLHNPPPPGPRNERKEVSAILKKELNLSEIQVGQMQELRNEFLKKEQILSEKIRAERDSMNVAMFNMNTNEQQVVSLAQRIAGNEYAMEILRFEQARQLKSICTPEQLAKFEKLIKEVRDYFKPDGGPKK